MAPMRELYRREFNRPEVIHTLLRAYGNLSTHLDKDSLAAVLTLLTKVRLDFITVPLSSVRINLSHSTQLRKDWFVSLLTLVRT